MKANIEELCNDILPGVPKKYISKVKIIADIMYDRGYQAAKDDVAYRFQNLLYSIGIELHQRSE